MSEVAAERPFRTWVLVLGGLGLLSAVLVSLQPERLPEGLSPAAMRTLGAAFLMGAWWTGSRLPLAVPSLVPLAVFPLLGILDSKQVASPYADRMVMLLLCGFLLALSIEKWGLHRRLALSALALVGRGPKTLAAGVMGVTAALSMWISNTATTLMMLPIVLALVSQGAAENPGREDANRRFAVTLLLGLAYAASIGGIATPIGTPPNLIFQGVYAETFPDAPDIDFLGWMRFALPVSLAMAVLAWLLLSFVLVRVPEDYRLGAREELRQRVRGLGAWSVPEKRVALGFAITAGLWILRGPLQSAGLMPDAVHDSTIAAFMAVLFFLTPSGAEGRLLEWRDAARVPWGLLLLFGGGIALSVAFKETGLTTWIGGELAVLAGLPAPLLVAGTALLVTFLTEITSNTATTALMLPVLAATAEATGRDPLLLMLPAVLAASCAFMLPVATAPNAIVIGSERVDGADMARVGLVLNLVGVVPITLAVLLLA